jgi:hypothetical protein
MKTWITRFDEELVERADRYLGAAAAHAASYTVLARYGLSSEELARGRRLVDNARSAFEWERAGKAWNFLSPTVPRRRREARHWYEDKRRRYVGDCLRSAETATGFFAVLACLLRAFSFAAWLGHRAELARDLRRASMERPAEAPPPKDTTLVELSGWYERWRLLAQRVFRERPDLMQPFGLVPGKAPPRLRSRSAQIKFGEKAAGSILARSAPLDPAVPLDQKGRQGEDCCAQAGDLAGDGEQTEREERAIVRD